MGKYNQLKFLKKTKARVNHMCDQCGKEIASNNFYFKEIVRDKFLHSLNAKKFCVECYEKFGENLIK